MKYLPRGHELLHQVILGALVCCAVDCVWWLAAGETPSLMSSWAVSFALMQTSSALLDLRNRREIDRLNDLWNRPPFGA